MGGGARLSQARRELIIPGLRPVASIESPGRPHREAVYAAGDGEIDLVGRTAIRSDAPARGSLPRTDGAVRIIVAAVSRVASAALRLDFAQVSRSIAVACGDGLSGVARRLRKAYRIGGLLRFPVGGHLVESVCQLGGCRGRGCL